MSFKRGKRDGLTGVLFNRGSFDKYRNNVDDKIKYIEMIFYATRTGQA